MHIILLFGGSDGQYESMLTRVYNQLGDVLIDEKCTNTNVVNELNIPMLVMGCRDLIIAASSDGILVSDKERSGYMKPYVEKIGGRPMYADKDWGSYRIIDMAPGVLTASLAVKAGCRFSYHSHALRNETWVITKGGGTVLLDGRERNVKPGDRVGSPSGVKHTLNAETGVTVIEVQSGSEIAADDKQMAEE